MSLPPRCERCGTDHHSYQAHVFRSTPSRVTPVVEEKAAAPAAKRRVAGQASSVKHGDHSLKHRMRSLGAQGGRVGGKARAAALTHERRSEIARAAAVARWGSK